MRFPTTTFCRVVVGKGNSGGREKPHQATRHDSSRDKGVRSARFARALKVREAAVCAWRFVRRDDDSSRVTRNPNPVFSSTLSAVPRESTRRDHPDVSDEKFSDEKPVGMAEGAHRCNLGVRNSDLGVPTLKVGVPTSISGVRISSGVSVKASRVSILSTRVCISLKPEHQFPP